MCVQWRRTTEIDTLEQFPRIDALPLLCQDAAVEQLLSIRSVSLKIDKQSVRQNEK